MSKIRSGITNGVDRQYDITGELRRVVGKSPLQSSMWRVILPNIQNSRNGIATFHPDTFDEIDSLLADSPRIVSEISERVSDISIPFMSTDTDKAVQGNSFWYRAKSNDISTITFSILEFEDCKTIRWLNSWQSMMINPDGTYNPPRVYKNDIIFVRLSTNKQDIMISRYKDYFISEIAEQQNDYESNEIVKYTVTLTGDAVEHSVFSIAGVRETKSTRDQLKDALNVDKLLDTAEVALQGVLSRAGININLPSF